ncbi:DUF3908 family protein [Bacillus toyonensis]|uniref:DUF3908 family protein n=1 Tax=Bacillus toyonensis TaxID=155322 RepID=UPI00115548DC|nr:DUF3908 family protein [Bacillus toyonensis]
MGITYTEFKERIRARDLNGFDVYKRIVEDLSELYDENADFVFYPKNLVNEKETELFFFFKGGYLTIKKEDNNLQYEQINCKLVSKLITISKYKHDEHLLKLEYDNGRELSFSSKADANAEWVEEYTKSIINLYKNI